MEAEAVSVLMNNPVTSLQEHRCQKKTAAASTFDERSWPGMSKITADLVAGELPNWRLW